MIKKLVLYTLSFMLCYQINLSQAEIDISGLCLKKELTCNDLNYILNTNTKNEFVRNNQNAVCSVCRLDFDSWACTTKESETLVNPLLYPLEPKNIEKLPACVKFPSCEELGFAFTSEEVHHISKKYSCSACPFDGNRWACAGQNGLIKPGN